MARKVTRGSEHRPRNLSALVDDGFDHIANLVDDFSSDLGESAAHSRCHSAKCRRHGYRFPGFFRLRRRSLFFSFGRT
jgi:hypothetical protein